MQRNYIPNPDAVAYSMLRFSSPEQSKGDSKRRQTKQAEDWCEKNKVSLDKQLWLFDPACSAYTGKHKENPDKHALAAFLKLIEAGKVRSGSYLLIENLDRLSREDEVPACHLLTGILLAGVRVVQLSPYEMILTEKSNGWELMRAVMELSRGHGESAIKSERVGAAWQEKKACAREGRPQPSRKEHRVNGMTLLTHCLPAWIEERGGKLHLVLAKAAVVKRIYEMAANGYGRKLITRALIRDKVPPICQGGRKGKCKQQVPADELDPMHWSASYVATILSDRRAVGEYQPKRKHGRENDGPPIPGYFPAAVSEEEWYAARAGAAERLKKRGRTSSNYVNVFAGLLMNARDGGGYFTTTRVPSGGRGSRQRVLINMEAAEGRAQCWSFPFDTFETAMFSLLREVDPCEVMGQDSGPDEVMTLNGEFTTLEADMKAISADLDANGESPTLYRRLRAKEARLAEVAKLLDGARQKASHPLSEVWGQFCTLTEAIEAAPDPIDARLRLRSALRRVVDSIWILVIARGHDRLCAVQVWFTEDGHRDYIILHRPLKSNGKKTTPGSWLAGSLADVCAPDNLDLRRREDAAALEQLLAHLDPEAMKAGKFEVSPPSSKTAAPRPRKPR